MTLESDYMIMTDNFYVLALVFYRLYCSRVKMLSFDCSIRLQIHVVMHSIPQWKELHSSFSQVERVVSKGVVI